MTPRYFKLSSHMRLWWVREKNLKNYPSMPNMFLSLYNGSCVIHGSHRINFSLTGHRCKFTQNFKIIVLRNVQLVTLKADHDTRNLRLHRS